MSSRCLGMARSISELIHTCHRVADLDRSISQSRSATLEGLAGVAIGPERPPCR